MRINEAIHVCNVIPTTKAGTNNWRNTLYDNRKQLASWLKELVRLRKENKELRIVLGKLSKITSPDLVKVMEANKKPFEGWDL